MKKSALILALLMIFSLQTAAFADAPAEQQEAITAEQTVAESDAQTGDAADAATDTTTAAAPTEAPAAQARELSRGDSGEDVRALMQRLHDLGYYTSDVDDKFGPGMAQAVKRFNLQAGFGAGETASIAMQEAAQSPTAAAYATLMPIITAVHLELYEDTPVFSVEVYNPQESPITFMSLIFRCFDAQGNEIYTSTEPGGEARFARYKDIRIGAGEHVDMRTVSAFDMSPYEGIARVEAALYCYKIGSSELIVPERYFAWQTSDGRVTPQTATQADIQPLNRTYQQDVQAARFALGAESEYIFAFESAHYGLPNGLYLSSVEPDGIAAAAGLQAGDVITSLAGVPLDFDEALYIIKSMMEPNVEYAIEYSRDGQTLASTIEWAQV